MKNIIIICLFVFLLSSCEQKTHYYCWKCEAIIYQKVIKDTFCHEEITEVENYKQRIIDFYQGGCTSIECVLISEEKTVK
jgi:hypothetical protein